MSSFATFLNNHSISSLNSHDSFSTQRVKIFNIPPWLNVKHSKTLNPKIDYRTPLQSFKNTSRKKLSLFAKLNRDYRRSDFPPYTEEIVEVAEAISRTEYPILENVFDKNDENKNGKGSLWGAVALITGTTVGAGILALPSSTSSAGFVPSVSLMLVCWAFLVVEALLMMEVNVALLNKHVEDGSDSKHSKVLSLATMAQDTMGPSGRAAVTIIYLFLSYTLMVAYITKSTEIFSFSNNLPEWTGGAIFTVSLGALLYYGDSKAVDHFNRFLTVGLLSMFVVIIIGGFSIAELNRLEVADWTRVPYVIPIVFLSLVYHDLIPVLCAYLDGDVKTLRKALIFGSLIPLSMFISWTAVSLSITDSSAAGSDPIQVFMQLEGGGMSLVIQVFSLLAIATSFIGSVIGFSEFFLEQFGPKLSSIFLSANNSKTGSNQTEPMLEILDSVDESKQEHNFLKPISFLFVLCPPLLVSMANPDSFLAASELAGAYGMTTLYGILPPFMYWKLQETEKEKQEGKASSRHGLIDNFLNFFNGFSPKALSLTAVGLCACGIIVQQALLDFSQAFPTRPSEVVVIAVKTDDTLNMDETDGMVNGLDASTLPLTILS